MKITVSLCLALALSVPSSAQESAPKVRELVARMEEDDIDVADQAAADLVALGPAALETLREIVKKREGDLKLRLDQVIHRIERQDRVRKAMGTPPLVTLQAKDRPIAEVLAKLGEQTGVRIEGEDLPADLTVSLDVQKALLWKVIDDLCRQNGKLMFAYTPKRVILQQAEYRALPHVFEKGFFFFVDNFTWTKYIQGGAVRSYCSLQAAVVWPPGTTPLNGVLEIQELEDDKGTNLSPETQQLRLRGMRGLRIGSQQLGDSIFQALYQNTQVPPADDATQLAKFRGRVILQFALDTARLLEIKKPVGQVGITQKEGGTSVLIRSCRRSGGTVRFEMEVTSRYSLAERGDDEDDDIALPWRMIVKDAKGTTHTARTENRGSSSSSGGGWMSETQNLSATFPVPDGVEVESLELIRASEAEEIVIPFQFGPLPFGK